MFIYDITNCVNIINNGSQLIRQMVISTGSVTRVSGTGSSCSSNGTGTSANINAPSGITTDGKNLYVEDQSNHRIRKID